MLGAPSSFHSSIRSCILARAVCAFMGFTLLTACQRQEAPTSGVSAVAKEEHARRTVPTQSIHHGTFEYSEQGQVVNALEAGLLERWEHEEGKKSSKSHWTVGQRFTLYIGGPKGGHDATLSALRGTYDDELGHLEAWDDVVLINEQGDQLLTEHLVWLHDSDVVRTNRPVEIVTDQGVLRGKGLRADSHFETYEILQPTGTFELGMEGDDTEP